MLAIMKKEHSIPVLTVIAIFVLCAITVLKSKDMLQATNPIPKPSNPELAKGLISPWLARSKPLMTSDLLNCDACNRDDGRWHVITNIFHPFYTAGLDASKITLLLANQRLEELIIVLNKKLADSNIGAVHIFYNDLNTPAFLQESKQIHNKHKIILHKTPHDPTYADTLRYASKFLLGKIVIFMNQDIYLGEGMEKINKTILCDKKVTYTLTRHGKQEKFCNMHTGRGDQCVHGAYGGAHDTYIFCLDKPIPEEMVSGKELDSKADSFGIENGWIWLFNHLGYKVLNPCFILKTYHVHCAQLHSKSRPQVLNHQKNAGAPHGSLLE